MRKPLTVLAVVALFATGLFAATAVSKPPPKPPLHTSTVMSTSTVTRTNPRTTTAAKTSGSSSGGSSSPSTSTKTVTVSETTTVVVRPRPATRLRGVARFRESRVAHAVDGDYAGAVETWRTRVLLLRRNKLVGTGATACIRIDQHTSIRECQATYILPRGRIQLAGEVITANAYLMMIVGGSGIYAGTIGVATVVSPIVTFYFS